MSKKIKLILSIFLFINFFNLLLAEENFFEEAKNKFNEKKLEDSKFLFQRNIVFNPKDAKSYMYLAKIYNLEENEVEEENKVFTKKQSDQSNMMEKINRHSAYKEYRAERNKQLLDNKWNYKKLLPLLESWSENTEYAEIIYQTIVDRNLP